MRNNFPVQAWRNLQSQPNSPYFLFSSIDIQAQAHYNRVIADGGIIPAGLLGCNAWFVAVKAVYGVTDITTAISAGYDPHYLGAKIGAGSGTTLGQAATKLYSCSGASGDLVQATAASMPLLLVKNASDANYWFGSGVSGNYCSTPNAAANQITGDIEIIAKIDKLSIGSSEVIVSKWYDGTSAYICGFTNANKPFLYWSTTGGNFFYKEAGDIISNGLSWLKVNRNSTTGDIKFYTSTNGVSYTQLGGTILSTPSGIYAGTSSLKIGTSDGSEAFKGKIYSITISNSIGGSPVVDFNPASYNAATSQTQWTSTTGEVWTINTGTATSGYKGQIVSFTCLQGDGIDDKLNSGALTSVSAFTRYVAANPFQRAGFGVLVSGGNSLNTAFYKDSSAIRIYNAGTGVGALSFITVTLTATRKYSPPVKSSNNPAIFKKVVLPEPDGPVTVTNSPCLT